MKYIFAISISLFICISQVYAQDYFYYYKEEKQILDLNTKYAFIQLSEKATLAQIENILEGQGSISRYNQDNSYQRLLVHDKKGEKRSRTFVEIRFDKNLSSDNYNRTLENLKKHSAIETIAPYFSTESENRIGLSNYFKVKLKRKEDLALLQEKAKETNTIIVGQNKFRPLLYTLRCDSNTPENALNLSNYFYESNLFSYTEPNLIMDIKLDCANDTYFIHQWTLQNTSQEGGISDVDIKACEAWDTTTGDPNVIVAIVDEGFEMNHPDLQVNTFGTGYNANSGTSPSQVLGSHGTACAGIVGAADNNEGIVGVAPNTSLMSISNQFDMDSNLADELADGIDWARLNGADIISNSWSGGTPIHSLDEAIDLALQNGRNGLGCIVLFSSGNENSSTSAYPSNSNPGIINVGAIDRCGYRSGRADIIPGSCDPWCSSCKAGSSYGTTLDVVAGGSSIPTTDRQGNNGYNDIFLNKDYTAKFGGTSAACPYVAGVAALILAANPCLSHQEVSDIIERTAQKVGPYTYTNTTDRPNGSWNNELGYGLVDASSAVALAQTLFLQNETEASLVVHQNPNSIRAGREVTTSLAAGDYKVLSNANVTFKAGKRIQLETGFKTSNGATFLAKIEPYNDNCENWINLREAAPIKNLASPSFREKNKIPSTIENKKYFSITNYPNPFSDQTTFEIQLQEATKVSLVIYDLVGKPIARLLDNKQFDGGSQFIEFDASHLPDGTYFYSLNAGGKTETKRLVIMR